MHSFAGGRLAPALSLLMLLPKLPVVHIGPNHTPVDRHRAKVALRHARRVAPVAQGGNRHADVLAELVVVQVREVDALVIEERLVMVERRRGRLALVEEIGFAQEVLHIAVDRIENGHNLLHDLRREQGLIDDLDGARLDQPANDRDLQVSELLRHLSDQDLNVDIAEAEVVGSNAVRRLGGGNASERT